MSNSYNQIKNGNTNVHFSNAMFGKVESSTMTARPMHLTTFNAGDLVPIYCREILPDESIDMSIDFVIRQTTLLTPTMGSMKVDFYAFFVPNRIVNQSWKAVEGENYSGSWTANPVSLAPLAGSVTLSEVQIPVGSVADYYGFPTQNPIPKSVLQLCHDLKFRGYVLIWNEFFRDQNYQPPIPMSTLNVYQGFLDRSTFIPLDGTGTGSNLGTTVPYSQLGDGTFAAGSIAKSIYGGNAESAGTFSVSSVRGTNNFKALDPPLKVNKLHDYFTSGLPFPQKGASIFVPVSGSVGSVPIVTSPTRLTGGGRSPLYFNRSDTGAAPAVNGSLAISSVGSASLGSSTTPSSSPLFPSNLVTDDSYSVDGLSLSVEDLRMSVAIQQYYETLARGGSRYREIVQSFFGIEVDDPFSDIPQCLGRITRDLDLYQTAQTSSSVSGNTPQGNLAAFGYTSSNGHLFSHRFVEHGYLHIFAAVRHRNIYPCYLARDNFRLNALDFYSAPLANISEQPVYLREINPFGPNPNSSVFNYQEAWAEYRYEPDMVTGLMRPGVEGSLALWNYSDDFDSGLTVMNGQWLTSNSQQVLDRTLAVTSAVSPQLKGQFYFNVTKTLPMPTYSVPGLDIV